MEKQQQQMSIDEASKNGTKGKVYHTKLENIGSSIDMQTHAGSSSTRP